MNYLIKEKPQNLTINLGKGKVTSVLELIRVFQKVNKAQIPYNFADRSPSENGFVVANNSFANRVLDFNLIEILKIFTEMG